MAKKLLVFVILLSLGIGLVAWVPYFITPATSLIDNETGECWRIMDWTRNVLVHCDVPHPMPADTEMVDSISRERWLRRYGG